MYYSEIKKTDVANCEGLGVSLFGSGCRNRCEGCFNPETWDFKHGRQCTKNTIEEILEACSCFRYPRGTEIHEYGLYKC